ncbi:MAG: hypothetical protein K2G42_05775 [Clostridia bacterium]|nr:hypothetical protein [Clostridia bacterium]
MSTNNYQVYIGGIVGCGSLDSCNSEVEITAFGITSTCYIGGLIGYATTKKISYSYNAGNISVKAYKAGAYVGGLIGYTSFTLAITNSYNMGVIAVDSIEGNNPTDVGGLIGYTSSSATITSGYNIGAITVNSASSSIHIGGLAGCYATIKNSHWLYYEDGAPVNAVGYSSGMGGFTNIGATKHMTISEFYKLADILNEGLDEPAFENKTASSLPTLIKKEN